MKCLILLLVSAPRYRCYYAPMLMPLALVPTMAYRYAMLCYAHCQRRCIGRRRPQQPENKPIATPVDAGGHPPSIMLAYNQYSLLMPDHSPLPPSFPLPPSPTAPPSTSAPFAVAPPRSFGSPHNLSSPRRASSSLLPSSSGPPC